MKKKYKKKIVAVLGGVALATSLILNFKSLKDWIIPPDNISGEWNIRFEVLRSSYKAYEGKVSEYKIHIIQDDKKIIGEGEKWKYNDEKIPHKKRDPMQISGTIIDNKIVCNYTLSGSRRETKGSFEGKFIHEEGIIRGLFSGTAADSKGSFIGKKLELIN